MLKYYTLMVCIVFSAYYSTGQTVDLSPNSYKPVNNNLNGFNLTRSWSNSVNTLTGSSGGVTGYGGMIDDDAITQFNDLNVSYLRFPGGGTADNYHPGRSGYGERADEEPSPFLIPTWDPAIRDTTYPIMKDRYAVNPASYYDPLNYSGWTTYPQGKNNIIYPFIDYLKKLNSDKNSDGQPDNHVKALYVLSIIPHFCFHDSLRYNLFNNVAVIENIQTWQDVVDKKDQGILSQAFFDIVQENYEAIKNLNVEVGVVGVEMGNEICNPKFQAAVTTNANFIKTGTTLNERRVLNRMVYTPTDSNSLRYYVALVKMYKNIIKNSIPGGSTIKIGVPVYDAANYLNLWNIYIYNRLYNDVDAYIEHTYFYDWAPTTIDMNMDADFKMMKDTSQAYMDKRIVQEYSNLKSMPMFQNKKLWITEWELKMDPMANFPDVNGPNRRKFANTMVHAMFDFENTLAFMDVNYTAGIRDFLEFSCHQTLNQGAIPTDTAEDNFPVYELSNINYNTGTDSLHLRALYYLNKLMQPILKDSINIVPGVSGLPVSKDLVYRMYLKKTPNGDKLYLAYENKGSADIASKLDSLQIIGGYHENGANHSYMYADNLSASCGMTTFRVNDRLLPDLSTSIGFSENNALPDLMNFAFRKYTIGILEIALEKDTIVNTNTCSFLHFDNPDPGPGDFLRIPANANLPQGKQDFTIEMCVRNLNANRWQVLASNATELRYPFNTNITLAYNKSGTNNQIEMFLNGKIFKFPPCKNLNTSTWHHLAMVKSGTKLNCYIDGILCKTVNYTNTAPKPNANNPWTIGGGDKKSTSKNALYGYFMGTTGDIDNVRIWNKARTAGEINTFKSAPVPPSTAGLMVSYDFNENSQVVTDLSGQGNNGTLGASSNAGTDDPAYMTNGCADARLANNQVEDEMTITYNEPDDLKMEELDGENLNIYPNPGSATNVNLVFNALEEQHGTLMVMDIQGKVIVNQDVYLETGDNNLNEPLKGQYMKGVYLVTLRTGSESFTKKMVLF